MKHTVRLLTAIAGTALCAACATTPADSKLRQYQDQLATNTQRFNACTEGLLKHYASSASTDDEKVIERTLKQCAVYASNTCSSQVQLDDYIAGRKVTSAPNRAAAESACLASLTTARRVTLLNALVDIRP